jgi:hypothetical protein
MQQQPPVISVPSEANVPEHLQKIAQEVNDKNLQEQQEEEYLPGETRESEEAEEEGDNNNKNNKEGGADATATTTPDAEGSLHSLIGLKDFNSNDSLTDEVFCKLFCILPEVLGN